LINKNILIIIGTTIAVKIK